MRTVPVSEFKIHFSKLLKEVRQGSTFEIVSDEDRTPIALFEPASDEKPNPNRKVEYSGNNDKEESDDSQMSGKRHPT